MTRIASVKAIIYYEGRFLLTRHRSVPDYWVFPGGGVEAGEDLLAGLRREMIEETTVEPRIGNLLFIQQIEQAYGYGPPEFFFHVTNAEDYQKHDLAGSSHGLAELDAIDWVDISDAPLLPEFMSTELPEAVAHDFHFPTRIRLREIT